jgi:outer membrane protein OmpA-like peptidoglycan-associated protein
MKIHHNCSLFIVHCSLRTFFFLVMCLLTLPGAAVWAQSRKLVQAYVAEGDTYWEKALYWEAAQQYTNACLRSPDNLYATYQLAECQRLLFNYPEAEKSYGKVYYAQSKEFPLALFYYSLMQKLNGKYVKAIQSFTRFSQQATQQATNQEMALLEPRANNEKEGCEMALLQKMLLRRDFEFQWLGSPVNTAYNDYAPIIADHDSALVITSGRADAKGKMQDARLGESLSDFFRFKAGEPGSSGKQTWQEFRGEDRLESINTKWGEGSGTFNHAHDAFYFASCLQHNGYCELYVTRLKNGKWMEPEKLNRNINQPGFDTRHPALTPGDDTLYFASNRPGGLGMNDLWMSIRAGDDNWGPPTNLGNAINTPLNDLSPFFDATENLLFFASDGHKGLGGLDIFMVKRDAYSQPVLTNLGAPFNSNMDDCFFIMGKELGYLSSNREGGLGNFDIYTFHINSKEAVLAILNQTIQLDLPDLAYLSLFNLDYLTQEEKLRVDRLVNRKITSHIHRTDLPLSAEDRFFYQQLSSQEKTSIERATHDLLQQVSEAAIAHSQQQDAFDYEHLSAEERNRLDRMTAANRQAQLRDAPLDLAEEDSFFYAKLSYQEQKRLDRLVASRLATLIEGEDAGLANLDKDAAFQYKKLPLHEQNRLNSKANSHIANPEANPDDLLSKEDRSYSVQLSKEDQKQLDQIVDTKIQQPNQSAASAKEEADFDYQKLSSEERKRLERLVAARWLSQQNHSGEQLKDEDAFYYSHLPTEEKNRLNRLIANRIQALKAADEASLRDKEAFETQYLPMENATHLSTRRTSSTGTQANQQDESELNNTFQMGRYHSVSLQGQLLKADSGLPSVGTEVLLVNARGITVKTTNTNQDGRFQFAYLSPGTSYRVLVNESQVRLTQVTQYQVNKLQMLGYDQEVADASFENIYFDSNQCALRPEARKVLDDLVNLCLKHTNLQVEINAFTDGLGSDAYNLELSRKRGLTVLDYLMKHQVDATALAMKAKGESKPTGSNNDPMGRQVNRRIEFTLKGMPSSFRSSTQTCITPAATTVESAAKTFGMTMQDLKELNGLTTNTIEAYRPIRVRKEK